VNAPAVRYYCLVTSGPGPFLGFDYLEAIDISGVGVRACPIGPAFIVDPPWAELMHLFSGGNPEGKYVNVVCAPLGYSLGARTTGIDWAGPKGDPSVVYQPRTALAGLYTVGVPNVAITLPIDSWGGADDELQVLQQYDFVFCPTDEHVEAFKGVGISAHHVPPDAGQLAKLFAVLLG
jgi:hypothetical protein